MSRKKYPHNFRWRRSLFRLFVTHALLFSASALASYYVEAADQLRLSPDDVRIDESIEDGFLLTIRKTPGMQSVLITESTKNPQQRGPVYSYVTTEYNRINGDERRILDGAFLNSVNRYYLVDSTSEQDEEWGEVYRVFIPYIVRYGFAETRSGVVNVGDGTFINIRAFELPFSDYRGSFMDNPFHIRIEQVEIIPEKSGKVLAQTEKDLTTIAANSSGTTIFANNGRDVTAAINAILNQYSDVPLDLVISLDTTRSMRDDIQEIRNILPNRIAASFNRRDEDIPLRLGIVLYRDYNEEYIATSPPLITDSDAFARQLDAVTVEGGGDEPEAVFESLHVALNSFPWQASQREILLIGDAPPHALPRGDITADSVYRDARQRGVNISTVILPR